VAPEEDGVDAAGADVRVPCINARSQQSTGSPVFLMYFLFDFSQLIDQPAS
jgi:hypothetical protein